MGTSPGNATALDLLSQQRDNRRMAARGGVIEVDFGDERARTNRARGKARLSPDDMLTFAAVARAGGVRSGAIALGIPRSTVSRQLAELERVLGAQLIARSTRRFALTEVGVRLVEQCERLDEILKTTDEVISRAAKEPTGTLRVAASPVVGEEFLPPVIAEYLRRFPQMSVDVRLSVDFVDLRRAGFDLAVRTGPLQEAGDLFATRLGTSLKGHFASPAYLEARGTPLTPEELSEHDCITIGGVARSAAWAFRSGSAEKHVTVKGSLKVDSYRLARSVAAEGAGIARLPDVFAAPLVKEGALVPVLERYWQRTVLFGVHAAGHPAPPKIRAFIELLREGMKRSLPA